MQPAHPVEPLRAGECFFIVSGGKWGKGSNLALEVDVKDKYDPRKTGVYNIALKEYEGIEKSNIAQQWYYDGARETVHSMLHPEGVLFEGYNNNVIVYKETLSMEDNQKFAYDAHGQKKWTNIHTGNALDIAEDSFKIKANVITEAVDDSPGQSWDIHYCKDGDNSKMPKSHA